ncbi:hypothetical protein [Novosphingobium sp.]|uniref:hypothetical protein n=1 Tax=Novosphingobium sp. TaxID=1874826 RepID=UPI0026296FBE|nr:hypothetical protein [Novosphingobium sp.]
MTPSAALRKLGLRAGADVAAIRKAYAALYKAMDPDADPEGYARLRQARDIALRAAKSAAVPPPAPAEAPEPSDEAAAPPAEPWLYGAPTVAHAQAADLPLLNAGQIPHPEPAPVAPQPIDAPAASAAALRALAGPPLLESAKPLRADVGYLAHPDHDLARLLHDSDAELGPLDDAGEALAQRCLRALLAEAATADLSRHARIEDWLADLLAETWPRSAPLLRPTAEAFGWENERGQITERPSIAWLNARLRGLRFQDKVTEPDHPLHKAWTELTRPGSATIVDKLRVQRSAINQLLEGVRKHFPELEHHFPRERVVSWGDGAASGWTGFGVFRIFGTGFTFNAGYAISIFVGLQIVMAILRSVAPDPVGTHDALFGPPAITATADPTYAPLRDKAVEEVFGKGKTIGWLRENQSSLATVFESHIESARSAGGRDEAGIIADPLEYVRRRVYYDGRKADVATLREMTKVRLALYEVARKEDPDVCTHFLETADMTSITVPEPVRAQERSLAAHMVERGVLADSGEPASLRATVPGALIGQVIKATELPEERVRLVLNGKGQPAERCAVIGALLRAALGWKGKEGSDILRVM